MYEAIISKPFEGVSFFRAINHLICVIDDKLSVSQKEKFWLRVIEKGWNAMLRGKLEFKALFKI
jgi:hypothetical protein